MVNRLPWEALYALAFTFIGIDVFYGLPGVWQNDGVDAIELSFTALMLMHHFLKTL